jgi:hypothetical protein
VFHNAITPVGPVSEQDLRRDGAPRLLFYARPEQHAQRNLFEIGVMALDRALEAGDLEGWLLAGVGTVEPGPKRLRLPRSGAELEMLPRRPQTEYAELLRGSDAGLALMYTPHPSLVPIEMAHAGLLAVTNSFENKDRAALAAISPNIVAAEPTVEAVSRALGEAAARAPDLAARAAGSRVAWPASWDDALGPALIERVESLLWPGR